MLLLLIGVLVLIEVGNVGILSKDPEVLTASDERPGIAVSRWGSVKFGFIEPDGIVSGRRAWRSRLPSGFEAVESP